MVNLLNRSQYGNLSCAWGVFQSRYTSVGDKFSLTDLKHSTGSRINSVDCCAGAKKFPPYLVESIGREYYCPFIQERLDPKVCQWVHSSDPGGDSQKSKPAGQTAIILQILGLAVGDYTKAGRLNCLYWTEEANSVHSLAWGSEELEDFIRKRLQGYGPLTSIANFLMNNVNDTFQSREITQHLLIQSTNEPAIVDCCGKTHEFLHWDSSSTDGATRSTPTLLGLLASIGVITPIDSNGPVLNASDYSAYLLNRIESTTSLPRKWRIHRDELNHFFDDHHLILGIGFRHFVPLSTNRERGDTCENCQANLLRKVRDENRTILRNRRLLLIRALEIADDKGGYVDLKKLSEHSIKFSDFSIDPSFQERILCTTTPRNVMLFGAINEVEGGFRCYPKTKFVLQDFDPHLECIPEILHTLDQICTEPGVIRK